MIGVFPCRSGLSLFSSLVATCSRVKDDDCSVGEHVLGRDCLRWCCNRSTILRAAMAGTIGSSIGCWALAVLSPVAFACSGFEEEGCSTEDHVLGRERLLRICKPSMASRAAMAGLIGSSIGSWVLSVLLAVVVICPRSEEEGILGRDRLPLDCQPSKA
jgi:hypothetical protein